MVGAQVVYLPDAHVLVAVGGARFVNASDPAYSALCTSDSGWLWDPAYNGSRCVVVHNATHIIDVATGRWDMWLANDMVPGGSGDAMGFPSMTWADPFWRQWGSAYARTITLASDPWIHGVVALGGMSSGQSPMQCGTPAFTYPAWLLRLGRDGVPVGGWQMVQAVGGGGPCLLLYAQQQPTLGAMAVSPTRHELIVFSGTDVGEYFPIQWCFVLDMDSGMWSSPYACQPAQGPGWRVRSVAWVDAASGSVFVHGGVYAAPFGGRTTLFADALVWRLDASTYEWSLPRVCVDGVCDGAAMSQRFSAKVAWLPTSRAALVWGGLAMNTSFTPPPGSAPTSYAYAASVSWCPVMAGGFWNGSGAALLLPTLIQPPLTRFHVVTVASPLPLGTGWPGGMGIRAAFAALQCVAAVCWLALVVWASGSQLARSCSREERTLVHTARERLLRVAAESSEAGDSSGEVRIGADDAAPAVTSSGSMGAVAAGELDVTLSATLRRWRNSEAAGPDDRLHPDARHSTASTAVTAALVAGEQIDPVAELFRAATAAAVAASLQSTDRLVGPTRLASQTPSVFPVDAHLPHRSTEPAAAAAAADPADANVAAAPAGSSSAAAAAGERTSAVSHTWACTRSCGAQRAGARKSCGAVVSRLVVVLYVLSMHGGLLLVLGTAAHAAVYVGWSAVVVGACVAAQTALVGAMVVMVAAPPAWQWSMWHGLNANSAPLWRHGASQRWLPWMAYAAVQAVPMTALLWLAGGVEWIRWCGVVAYVASVTTPIVWSVST